MDAQRRGWVAFAALVCGRVYIIWSYREAKVKSTIFWRFWPDWVTFIMCKASKPRFWLNIFYHLQVGSHHFHKWALIRLWYTNDTTWKQVWFLIRNYSLRNGTDLNIGCQKDKIELFCRILVVIWTVFPNNFPWICRTFLDIFSSYWCDL